MFGSKHTYCWIFMIVLAIVAVIFIILYWKGSYGPKLDTKNSNAFTKSFKKMMENAKKSMKEDVDVDVPVQQYTGAPTDDAALMFGRMVVKSLGSKVSFVFANKGPSGSGEEEIA